MRSLLVMITFCLVPPLLARQQHQQSLADCEKTAQTQTDLAECGSADYKTAVNELNRTYEQLLKKAASDPVAVEKIKAAQTAWVGFRDAQIAALYPAADKQRAYGTVFPMCADLAMADLTRERTKMLKHMLNPVEGDVCDGGSLFSEGNQNASPTK